MGKRILFIDEPWWSRAHIDELQDNGFRVTLIDPTHERMRDVREALASAWDIVIFEPMVFLRDEWIALAGWLEANGAQVLVFSTLIEHPPIFRELGKVEFQIKPTLPTRLTELVRDLTS